MIFQIKDDGRPNETKANSKTETLNTQDSTMVISYRKTEKNIESWQKEERDDELSSRMASWRSSGREKRTTVVGRVAKMASDGGL